MPRRRAALAQEPVYTGISSLPSSGIGDGTIARVRAASGLPAFRVAYNATTALWEPEGVAKLGEIAGSGLTAMTFSSIPQIFSHLKLYVRGQSQAATTLVNFGMRLNGATGAYSWEYGQVGAGSAWGAADLTGNAYGYIGSMPGTSRSNVNYISDHVIELPGYSRTDSIKSWTSQWILNSGPGVARYGGFAHGNCDSFTTGITSVALGEYSGGNVFGPAARATLYGIP